MRPSRAIRAVLFDLDDTLVVERAAADAALLETCRLVEQSHGTPPQELRAAVYATARRLWRASDSLDYCRKIGISSWEGLWGDFAGTGRELELLAAWIPSYRRRAWSEALGEFGVEDAALAERLGDEYRHRRRLRHELARGAAETLAVLRERYRLALVTNGAVDMQTEKIDATGLAQYFDTVVISGAVGFGKPAAGVFRVALERLGVPSEEAVVVGDSLERDVRGARACGIRAIWMRNGDGSADTDGAEGIVSELAELPRTLAGLGG